MRYVHEVTMCRQEIIASMGILPLMMEDSAA